MLLDGALDPHQGTSERRIGRPVPGRDHLAVRYGVSITHILLNHGELAKISDDRRAAEYAVWQTSLHNPDFAAFARNCGARGVRVEDPADLSVAITRALDHRGPALVEISTDPQSRQEDDVPQHLDRTRDQR